MAKTMASLQAFPSYLLPRAWSWALIPFPFPFERLPHRLIRARGIIVKLLFHAKNIFFIIWLALRLGEMKSILCSDYRAT